ncbi:MAG: hypothetical protein RLZZ519_541 [Bacteroidota bacterium]
MRKSYMLLLWTLLIFAGGVSNSEAQVAFTTDNPAEYSNYIVAEQEKIGEQFIEFSNLLLSSNEMKANEEKRLEVVRQIELGLRRLRNMGPFKGGAKLRDESVAVFEAYRDLHVNDYAKIAMLVSNKESSLSALEDYFQMQVKAEKKMLDFAVRLRTAQNEFAKLHRLTLLHNGMQDQFDRILECNIYSREIFLQYIAVAKINELWWDAMEKNDIAEMNKHRLALVDAVQHSKLAGMPDFHGDSGFRDAAKARVAYFGAMANKEYPEITRILESTQRTQEDVDYVNTTIDAYNSKNLALNDSFNAAHRDLKLKSLPAPSGGGSEK